MMHFLLLIGSTLLFFFIDFGISIGCYGFYHTSFGFNFTTVLDNLLLRPNGYQFATSPLDFLILVIFRFFCLCICSVILFKKKTLDLSLVFVGADICNLSFTLTKVLGFSEVTDQLYYCGVWFNVAWNISCQFLLHIFWCKYLCHKISLSPIILSNGINNYERLHENHDVGAVENSTVVPDPESAVYENSPLSSFTHFVLLMKYCGKYWLWFLCGLVFLVFYAGTRMFIPLYTATVVSNILEKGHESFYKNLIIMGVLAFTSGFFGGLRGGIFTYTTTLLDRRMRNDLFASIIHQEIAFFDNAQTGEILSRLTADTETMSTLISTNVNIFLRNAIMVVGSFIVMFSISWRLTLVTFIAIPPIAFFTKVYGKFYARFSDNAQKTIADANAVAEEVLSTMRTVRSFACEAKERKRFEKHTNLTLAVAKKKAMAFTVFAWLNESANNIVLISVLCYGGYLVLTNKMTIDGIVAFLLYQVQLGENFYSINYVFSGLMEGIGASRKVFEYLRRKPKILCNGTFKTKVEGKIEFSNVSFAYPTRLNTLALRNVSFCVEPGETIALVGPSGAGKSSIISLIELFYECDEGQILLDNTLINKFDHGYFHQKIALVAQEPVLYGGSIRYNILYGLDEGTVSHDKMCEAAKLANIHDFIMENKDGYEMKCGEKGVQMSGGQKQRIAIARALVRDPAVLILDEATSALDAESEAVIKEAIQTCSVGRTVLIIAHRLSTVENADRIIVIDKGRIVQIGSHQNLITDTNGLYYSLAKKQLLGSSK